MFDFVQNIFTIYAKNCSSIAHTSNLMYFSLNLLLVAFHFDILYMYVYM